MRRGEWACYSAGHSDTSLYILGVCKTLTAIVICLVGSRVIASLAHVTPSLRGRVLWRPMPGSAHVDPVAVQLQSDFLFIARYKEWLQCRRDGKVDSRIHFLKRSLKLDGAFSARLTPC